MDFFVLALLASMPARAQVNVTQSSDRIHIEIDGKPYSDLYIGPDTGKPYLHPLRSASGKIVTRRYPMENIEGESKDHPHHRGLWFTHGEVNGLNFWANEPSQHGRKGYVVLNKVIAVNSGEKSGSLTASFDWQEKSAKPLLAELRTMTFYADPTLRIIDFDATLKANEITKFIDTKEGMFAIRLATPLEEKHTGTMTNAEGAQKEPNIWGKRSPWVDYAGEIDGEKLAVAIFDHPENPRHPTYWHARAYGLFATNIFGVHDFEDDKTKDGSLTLKPGETLRFRYRVVIHPGDATREQVAEMYAKYAHPVE
jgi:Methane oxygenase PmoA